MPGGEAVSTLHWPENSIMELTKSSALIEWIQRFCHMIFANYNPKNDTKIYRIFFVRLFSEEIWKIPFCHFLNIFELLVMKQIWRKNVVWIYTMIVCKKDRKSKKYIVKGKCKKVIILFMSDKILLHCALK